MQTRAHNRVAWRGAVCRAADEGIRVKPAGRYAVVDRSLLAPDKIRTRPQCVDTPSIAALQNLHREAAGQRNHTAHRPATGGKVQCTTELFAGHHVPDIAQDDAMALIEHARGTLRSAAIARVLTTAAAGI